MAVERPLKQRDLYITELCRHGAYIGRLFWAPCTYAGGAAEGATTPTERPCATTKVITALCLSAAVQHDSLALSDGCLLG